jgi:hypothetical protein
MDKYSCDRPDPPQECRTHSNSSEQVQFLLRSEEEIIRSISARSPLPDLLDRICSALDLQIGNAISLIFPAGHDASELATITANASLFGLHTFCCKAIVAGNGEVLGSLHMYSWVPRSPCASEIQLIERARCLAAIAITFDNETGHQGYLGPRGSRFVRESVLEWPVSTN